MTCRILFSVVTLTVWFGCGAGSVTLMNDLEMTSTAVYHDGWWYLPSVGHTVRRGSPDHCF